MEGKSTYFISLSRKCNRKIYRRWKNMAILLTNWTKLSPSILIFPAPRKKKAVFGPDVTSSFGGSSDHKKSPRRSQVFSPAPETKHTKKWWYLRSVQSNYHTFSLIFKIIKNYTIKYLLSFLYINLLFNKLSLCPYMVRKPSISVIRTWQISCDIRKWPYLEVHCRFSFIACLAAILKSEAVLAVFSGNFNSLEETFHD